MVQSLFETRNDRFLMIHLVALKFPLDFPTIKEILVQKLNAELLDSTPASDSEKAVFKKSGLRFTLTCGANNRASLHLDGFDPVGEAQLRQWAQQILQIMQSRSDA